MKLFDFEETKKTECGSTTFLYLMGSQMLKTQIRCQSASAKPPRGSAPRLAIDCLPVLEGGPDEAHTLGPVQWIHFAW